MTKEESVWIYETIINIIGDRCNINILNIGSSTKDYREIKAPHVSQNLFLPLSRLATIKHSDIKNGEGVDFVGDIFDHDFRGGLKEKKFEIIICSNLLEHVLDPIHFMECLKEIISKDSVILFTCPYFYPRHNDPIDNMFRPSPYEIKGYFNNYSVCGSDILIIEPYWKRTKLIKLFKSLVRCFIPFYNYSGWETSLNKMLWAFRPRAISCIALKKIN